MQEVDVTTEVLKYLGTSGVTAAVLLFIVLRNGRKELPKLHKENTVRLDANQKALDDIMGGVEKILSRVGAVEVRVAQIAVAWEAHDKQDDERWRVYREEHLRLQGAQDALRLRVDRLSEK